MKLRFTYTLFLAAMAAFIFMGNSDGRAGGNGKGNTGAPGDEVSGGQLRTCQTCHNSGTIGMTMDLTVFDSNGTIIDDEYTPGQTYTVTVRMNHVSGATPGGYGFQMVSLFDTDNSDVAAWSNPSGNTKIATASSNGRSYAEHFMTSTTNEFSAEWTAPDAGKGSVTFYSSGNGVNVNGTNGGDGAAITTLQLGEGSTSNTANLANRISLDVFPNPVSDWLTIEMESTTQTQYQMNVLDIMGRVLQKETMTIPTGTSTQLIDLSRLKSGTYIVQLLSEQGTVLRKIFKD